MVTEKKKLFMRTQGFVICLGIHSMRLLDKNHIYFGMMKVLKKYEIFIIREGTNDKALVIQETYALSLESLSLFYQTVLLFLVDEPLVL